MNPQPDTLAIAKRLAETMIERRDAKAIQGANGAYAPAVAHVPGKHDDHSECPRIPWELKDIVAHIDGTTTYGHYVVSAENTCRMFCFDIDLLQDGQWMDTETEQWTDCKPREVWLGEDCRAKGDLRAQLYYAANGLASRVRTILDVPALVAYSGSKGLHVYGLLDRGTPAADAREAAMLVLDSVDCWEQSRGKNFFKHAEGYRGLELEVYPKQDTVREGDGLGNLLRLPLGINRKTGQRGFFVNLDPIGHAAVDPFKPDDALLALTHGSYRLGVKL